MGAVPLRELLQGHERQEAQPGTLRDLDHALGRESDSAACQELGTSSLLCSQGQIAPSPEQSVIVLSHQSMTIGKFTFYLNRRFHVRTFFLDEYHKIDLLRFVSVNPDMIVLVSATPFHWALRFPTTACSENTAEVRLHGGDWSPKMLPCGVCEACADGSKSCTRSKAFNEDLQLYFRELMRCCDPRLQSQGYDDDDDDDGKSMISLRGARALFRVLDWIVVSGEVPRETIAGCRSLRRSAFSEEIVDLGLVVPEEVSQKIVTSLTKIKKNMHHASQASSDPFLRIQRALGPIWYTRTDDGRNLSDRVAQVVFDRLAREVRDTVVVHSSDVHLNLTRLVEGEYMFRDKVYRIERQDGDQRDRLLLPNRTLDHLVLRKLEPTNTKSRFCFTRALAITSSSRKFTSSLCRKPRNSGRPTRNSWTF